MLGLDHVFIKSENLKSASEFYTEILEMETAYASWDDNLLMLECGTGYIGFVGKEAKTNHPAGGPSHIAISLDKEKHEHLIDKIQKNHNDLQTRGPLEFDDNLRNTGKFKAFFVNDPDGNEIELLCRDYGSGAKNDI